MRAPVLTKRDMYARLAAGEFGNRLASWKTLCGWLDDPLGYASQELWGVRSMTANDPRARLNCPRDLVAAHLRATGLINSGFDLSAMIPDCRLWEGDVYDHPSLGLIASGTLRPVPGTWRTHMKKPQVWERSAAMQLLRTVLNENSFDDLMILVEQYPEHVYEMTVLDRCYGVLPGRNAVLYEVRKY